MATIDWPAALRPQTFSPGIRKAGLQFRSPFNGTAQSVDFVAERWLWSLALAPMRSDNPLAGQAEALLMQLAGGVERVRCWHFARPQPVGTLRGSPTLSSSVSRGALSLPLQSVVGSDNLLFRHSNFDNAYWTKEDVTITSTFATAPDGTSTAAVATEGSGASTTHRVFRSVTVSPAGAVVTGSVYVRRGLTGSRHFRLDLLNSTDAIRAFVDLDTGTLSSTSASGAGAVLGASCTSVGGSWYRVTLSGFIAGVSTYSMYLTPIAVVNGTAVYSGDGSSTLRYWGAQLCYGAAAQPYAYDGPTLKAGDLIGAGGQIFQVSADVSFGQAGSGTVSVLNRARGTIASGAAVTWDKPTAEFIMPANSVAASWRPMILNGLPFDLEEVW